MRSTVALSLRNERISCGTGVNPRAMHVPMSPSSTVPSDCTVLGSNPTAV
jgi:hypothetical protein